MEWIPWSGLQKMKDIVDTMDTQSWAVYNKKKAALLKGEEYAKAELVGEGKDIMSILRKYPLILLHIFGIGN